MCIVAHVIYISIQNTCACMCETETPWSISTSWGWNHPRKYIWPVSHLDFPHLPQTKQTTTKFLLYGPPLLLPLRSSQGPQAKSPKTPGEIALAYVPLLRWHPSDRQRPPPRASAMVTPRRVPRDPRSNAISNVSPGKKPNGQETNGDRKGTGWTTFKKTLWHSITYWLVHWDSRSVFVLSPYNWIPGYSLISSNNPGFGPRMSPGPPKFRLQNHSKG